MEGHIECVGILLDGGADLNASDKVCAWQWAKACMLTNLLQDGRTALFMAVYANRGECVRVLLEKHADSDTLTTVCLLAQSP